MTELQQVFLFYTFIYFIVKGALFVGLYIATIVVEKHARDRHRLLKKYLAKKRKQEEERWSYAYSQLNKKVKQKAA